MTWEFSKVVRYFLTVLRCNCVPSEISLIVAPLGCACRKLIILYSISLSDSLRNGVFSNSRFLNSSNNVRNLGFLSASYRNFKASLIACDFELYVFKRFSSNSISFFAKLIKSFPTKSYNNLVICTYNIYSECITHQYFNIRNNN